MLLVDAANVVGSRPNGWWRDRPGAAREVVERIRAATAAGRLPEPVVVVLEGLARAGVGQGTIDGVDVVHAPGSGDDTIVDLVALAIGPVVVVTSDGALRRRVESFGADVVGPRSLLSRLET